MNELMKRINHFNPYAIWFIFGLSLITITLDFINSDYGFVIIIYMLFLMETLYFNYRNKEYIKMTNNVENVFRDNILVLGAVYIFISAITIMTNEYYIIYDVIPLLTVMFGGFAILYDLFISGKKEQKFTYLAIDLISAMVMIQLLNSASNYYSYGYLPEIVIIPIIPVILATIAFMVLCMKRHLIKYNMNIKELIIGLIAALFLVIVVNILIIEIRYSSSMLIFAKLPIILIVLTVNFYLANLLWDLSVCEMVSSSKDFLINAMTLISVIMTAASIFQVMMLGEFVLELVVCLLMMLSVLIIRKSRGLNVWI